MNQTFENVDNCVNFKKQQQNSAYFDEKRYIFTSYLMNMMMVATKTIIITARNDIPAIKDDSLQLSINSSICKSAGRIKNNHCIAN